mgnify:CR=1 FL=1
MQIDRYGIDKMQNLKLSIDYEPQYNSYIDKETYIEIDWQKKAFGYMLYVEIEGQDNDGYKPSQFFQINYCPMCGRELKED